MTSDKEGVDTATQVKQAADQLLREGRAREITVRAIHAIIGYGSSTTINNALDAWYAALGARINAHEELPGIPAHLQAQVVDLLMTLQRTAQAGARDALAEHERRADQRVETANVRAETATAAKDAVEQRATTLASRVDQLETQLRALETLRAAEQARRESAEQHALEARRDAEHARHQALAHIAEFKAHQALEQAQAAQLELRLIAQLDEHKTARQRLEQTAQENERAWRDTERQRHERIITLEQEKSRLAAEATASARERDTLLADKQALTLQVREHEVVHQAAQARLNDAHREHTDSLAVLRAQLAQAEAARVAAEARATESAARAQRIEERLLAQIARTP